MKTFRVTKIVSQYEYFEVEAKTAEELTYGMDPDEIDVIDVSYTDTQEI